VILKYLFSLQLEKASGNDRMKSSLGTITRNIDTAQIDGVFAVFDATDIYRRRTQYVVLLHDGSYICTCLLLQNSGFVCRHFFHLMQVDYRFKYHLKLIPNRWHTESTQDKADFDISARPFVHAKVHILGDETIPDGTYMSDVLKAFPLTPTILPDHQAQLSKKRQFAEISSQFKEVSKVLEENPEMFGMVKDSIDEIIVKGRGFEGMRDPPTLKAKGRPKKSRIKSSQETQTRSTKCGVCNEVGHNARKHHGLQKEHS